MTPAILLSGLRHSFFHLSMIKVLIVDECHHARGKHPYACIMTVIFIRLSNLEDTWAKPIYVFLLLEIFSYCTFSFLSSTTNFFTFLRIATCKEAPIWIWEQDIDTTQTHWYIIFQKSRKHGHGKDTAIKMYVFKNI